MVVYVEIVPRSYRETSDTFQEIFREFHVLPKWTTIDLHPTWLPLQKEEMPQKYK